MRPLALVVLLVLSAGLVASPVQAQAPTPTNAGVAGKLGSTSVVTGKLSKALGVLNEKGNPTTIPQGSQVELLAVTDGVIESGLVRVTFSGKGTFQTENGGTVTYANVGGAALSAAKLNDVQFAQLRLKDKPEFYKFDKEKANLEEAGASPATLATAIVAAAEINKTDVKAGATEASDLPLAGDYFKLLVDVPGFVPSDQPNSTPQPAPQGSCFRVSQDIPAKEGASPKLARGTFVTRSSKTWLENVLPPIGCVELSGGLRTNLSYDVPAAMLVSDRDRLRYGWTYGLLVVPFKFYVKDKEFNAGATVGPYLGFRMRDRPGAVQTLAVAIGPTAATATTTNNGKTESETTTGLTTALAYIGTIKGSFNYALVFGRDHFSKSDNIDPVRRKNWVGLAFGFDIK